MPQLEPLPEPEKTISTSRKFIEVMIGFGGWYIANGVIWLLVARSSSSSAGVLITCSLPGNIILLLVCALTKRLRRVALGILIALALNFVISLFVGMVFNALCFIPFFYK